MIKHNLNDAPREKSRYKGNQLDKRVKIKSLLCKNVKLKRKNKLYKDQNKRFFIE